MAGRGLGRQRAKKAAAIVEQPKHELGISGCQDEREKKGGWKKGTRGDRCSRCGLEKKCRREVRIMTFVRHNPDFPREKKVSPGKTKLCRSIVIILFSRQQKL